MKRTWLAYARPGSPALRRWTGLAVGGIPLAFLALAIWLAVPPARPGPVLTFGVDGTRKGSNAGGMQFIIFDPKTGLPDNFIALASFTNNGRVPLQLGPPSVHWDISNYPPFVELQNWGGAGAPTIPPATSTGALFSFSAPSFQVPPKGVALLPIGPPLPGWPPHPEFVLQRFRFVFDYTADTRGARRVASHIVRQVPKKLLSQRLADWLLRNGLMDGHLHRHFESDWQPYPFAAPG